MAVNNTTSISYWLEELDTFKWWKKRRRRRYLHVALLIMFLEVFIIIGIFKFSVQSTQMEDIIFCIFGMICFFLIAVFFFGKWLRIDSLRPTDAVKVIVTEKSRFSKNRLKRHENRAYYLTGQIATESVEGLCEAETYRATQIGETVAFFRINSKQYFAIHLGE